MFTATVVLTTRLEVFCYITRPTHLSNSWGGMSSSEFRVQNRDYVHTRMTYASTWLRLCDDFCGDRIGTR